MLSRSHEFEAVNFSSWGSAPSLLKAIAGCRFALIWFAGGHAAAAILLIRLLKKKSIIVVGGFDVACLPEINYGRFTQSRAKRLLTTFALNLTCGISVLALFSLE